ncbi:glycosyltransferase [Rhizobium terrae]|uniref:glycosyltransferase n=1 Tax=Rhizobium terrae TaxID=2171756 RepID=UPI000E3E7F8F|nr:glycosyltransferase [Rhizobium terrae]
MNRAITFYWDNLGPMHVDRLEAVKNRFPGLDIIGIEIREKSNVYDWSKPNVRGVDRITLFRGKDKPTFATHALKLIKSCFSTKGDIFFFCNYEEPVTFLAATILRFLGKKVYVMGVTKFDDQRRKLWREVGKRVFMLPYSGALGSGNRPKDYFRFLGVPEKHIYSEYNTLSIARIRTQAKVEEGDEVPFSKRNFIVIARFVPKKNLSVALEAFAKYTATASVPRRLVLCGSGPLEADLRSLCVELQIAHLVDFFGFLQTEEVSRELARALCLLLPSVEEQFGNVVIEAQALGVPAILSEVCGARDLLIRNAVNGFVVEPDNPDGFAFFMQLIGENEKLWGSLAKAALKSADCGDVSHFADGVSAILLRHEMYPTHGNLLRNSTSD